MLPSHMASAIVNYSLVPSDCKQGKLRLAPSPGGLWEVVRNGDRLRWQHPQTLYGAGANGHPEATDRRPLGASLTLRQPTDSSIPVEYCGKL